MKNTKFLTALAGLCLAVIVIACGFSSMNVFIIFAGTLVFIVAGVGMGVSQDKEEPAPAPAMDPMDIVNDPDFKIAWEQYLEARTSIHGLQIGGFAEARLIIAICLDLLPADSTWDGKLFTDECCLCGEEAEWARHYRSGSKDRFCANHAQKEDDFGKEDDNFFWEAITD